MTTYLQAYFPETSPETLSAAGPVSVNTYMTYLKTTTENNIIVTLNDAGSTLGQIKKLLFVADGGGNVIITSDLGNHNITLEDVGDYATFMWNGSIWRNIELIN